MANTFPGTTIEVTHLEKGSSKQLFDGIFAAGGITLSQVCVMTSLEPYMIQNWVKRGFLSPPQKRLYSKEQFARIVIINMLREALQLDHICKLLQVIGGALDDATDDLISDDALYHRYVDMLTEPNIRLSDAESVQAAVCAVSSEYRERLPGGRKLLERILQVMLYAHAAADFRKTAEEILSSLQ